jgi:hypothetical protein
MTTDGQKQRIKGLLLWLILCIPYFVLVVYLALQGSEKIRAEPGWFWWGMGSYFFGLIFALPLIQWMMGRKRTRVESNQSWEDIVLAKLGRRRVRRLFAIYFLTLIGGIGFAIFGVIPWLYAIPGAALVSISAAFHWRVLSATRPSDDAAGEGGKSDEQR